MDANSDKVPFSSRFIASSHPANKSLRRNHYATLYSTERAICGCRRTSDVAQATESREDVARQAVLSRETVAERWSLVSCSVSVFRACSCLLAGVERVFLFLDTADQICLLGEVLWFLVTTGKDEFQPLWLRREKVHDRLRVD
ncbi:MAG: hypothetical protein A07HR60_01229 [uncultured archaeon A07HR60]|nr:MAG: hypothetical protein A07HR60_01229 [uncultured archaeon A07HR60]